MKLKHRAYRALVVRKIALAAWLKGLVWTHFVKRLWPGACLGSTDFRFSRSSRVGLDGVVIALTEQTSVPIALAAAFEDCLGACEDFDLVMRAPLDRLQQRVSMTASGTVGERRFVFSADIDLVRDSRLWKTRKILEGAHAMFLRNDPAEALADGFDPVPQHLNDGDGLVAGPATQNHPPPYGSYERRP